MPVNMGIRPFEQSVFHAPAANTQATCVSAAPGTVKGYIVVRSIAATFVADTAGPGEGQLTLRDGNGAGTILWSQFMRAAANSPCVVNLSDINIKIPTPGNTATLQFEAAG